MLNTDNEIWKPVPDFERFYEASTHGNIRNLREKVMKTYAINSGYQALKFTINGDRTSHLVHRLVALTFLDNPDELPEVNHIDEDKTNNRLDNLEWKSSSGNKQHSIATGTYDKIYTTKNSLGKKHLPNNYSEYHNVSFDKNRDRWVGSIRVDGKNMHSKRFKTEEEAALHVNWIIDELGLTDRPKNIIG